MLSQSELRLRGEVRPTVEKLNRKAQIPQLQGSGAGAGVGVGFRLDHKESKQAFQCRKIMPKIEGKLLLKT